MKQGVSTNDTSAWQGYRTNLNQFVRKRVADPSEAEDIVQDVLVKAYSALATLKDNTKLQRWLYQITRNAIIDHYRRHKPLEELTDSFAAPDAIMHNTGAAEFAQCLRPLIEQLPPDYRQAILLAEIEGLTQQELAIAENLSLSGAKSRVQRGRKLLKSIILQCCQVEVDQHGTVTDWQTQRKDQRCGVEQAGRNHEPPSENEPPSKNEQCQCLS